MPPKADPYATKSARTFDLVLIVFAIAAIVILIWTAPRHRPDTGAVTAPAPMKLASNNSTMTSDN